MPTFVIEVTRGKSHNIGDVVNVIHLLLFHGGDGGDVDCDDSDGDIDDDGDGDGDVGEVVT